MVKIDAHLYFILSPNQPPSEYFISDWPVTQYKYLIKHKQGQFTPIILEDVIVLIYTLTNCLNNVLGFCLSTKIVSVASTMVYPLNWATLTLTAASKLKKRKRKKKLLGGWPKVGVLFIWLPVAAFFFLFFHICQFSVNSESFEPLECPRSLFSSISSVKTSWKAININYPSQAEINNLMLFPRKWVILIISTQKYQNFRNWMKDYLKKLGHFKVAWRKQDSQFAIVWHWSFGNTGYGSHGATSILTIMHWLPNS